MCWPRVLGIRRGSLLELVLPVSCRGKSILFFSWKAAVQRTRTSEVTKSGKAVPNNRSEITRHIEYFNFRIIFSYKFKI
jgi:hypothetical protein